MTNPKFDVMVITAVDALIALPRLGRYTGCPRRNVPDLGRFFLMLKYTDITQFTYAQS
jgi:hypothetical protein